MAVGATPTQRGIWPVIGFGQTLAAFVVSELVKILDSVSKIFFMWAGRTPRTEFDIGRFCLPGVAVFTLP